MNPSHVGTIGEKAVELDLLKRGYTVLIPSVPSRYDLIAEKDASFYRIQVKTAHMDDRDGCLRVAYSTPYTPSEIDYVAVYYPDTDTTYYVPITHLQTDAKGITLRLTERTQKRQRRLGLMASEYTEFPYVEVALTEGCCDLRVFRNGT